MIQSRIINLCFTTLALVMVLTGCKKSPVATDVEPKAARFSLVRAPKEATPAAATSAAGRAVSGDEFLKSSMIGVYASQAAITDLSTALNTNVGYANQTGNSIWSNATVGDPIYFLENDAPMNFYAYHPFSGQANSSVTLSTDKVGVLNYTTPTDQSSEENLKLADLMCGNAQNKRQSDGTVNLSFYHKLAKLSLKIKKGGDWNNDEVNISQIVISGTNVLQSAKLSLSDGVLTPLENAPGAVGTITSTMPAPQVLDVLNEYRCEFILVPSNTYLMTISFTVGDGSVPYETTLTSSLVLKGGTQLNLGIMINKFSPINIYLNPTIEEWNFTSHVNVDGI